MRAQISVKNGAKVGVAVGDVDACARARASKQVYARTHARTQPPPHTHTHQVTPQDACEPGVTVGDVRRCARSGGCQRFNRFISREHFYVIRISYAPAWSISTLFEFHAPQHGDREDAKLSGASLLWNISALFGSRTPEHGPAPGLEAVRAFPQLNSKGALLRAAEHGRADRFARARRRARPVGCG